MVGQTMGGTILYLEVQCLLYRHGVDLAVIYVSGDLMDRHIFDMLCEILQQGRSSALDFQTSARCKSASETGIG
jgi:hypothetical protein